MKRVKSREKKTQYVIPVGNAWAVKQADSEKITIFTDNKKEAVIIAKDIAKRNESDLIIYGKNGKIAAINSYAKKGKVAAKA